MFIAYFPAFIYIDVVKFTRVNGGTVGRDFILFYFILFYLFILLTDRMTEFAERMYKVS